MFIGSTGSGGRHHLIWELVSNSPTKSGRRAAEMAEGVFHISASVNRESIRRHGLDNRYMGAAPGVFGIRELHGFQIYVCEWDHIWLVGHRATFPTDLWAVRSDREVLKVSGTGVSYLEGPVPPEALRLVLSDIPPMSDDMAEQWGRDHGI
jgi:hypothetical protein